MIRRKLIEDFLNILHISDIVGEFPEVLVPVIFEGTSAGS
jgi:hypothetical protein